MDYATQGWEDKWKATHRIVLDNGETETVMLCEQEPGSGPAYTEFEWDCCSFADYEVTDGAWTRNGKAFSGRVERIRDGNNASFRAGRSASVDRPFSTPRKANYTSQNIRFKHKMEYNGFRFHATRTKSEVSQKMDQGEFVRTAEVFFATEPTRILRCLRHEGRVQVNGLVLFVREDY